MINVNRIAYIVSAEYLKECDRNVKVINRASITHTLIMEYGLSKGLTLITPKVACESDLTSFHSQDYVQYLKSVSKAYDVVDAEEEESLEYGLGYDCPVIPNLFSYVTAIAGATITAAQCLVHSSCDISINWGGGWHHAKKDEAAGFCYVNDIVLGILTLRLKFERVLYIDLDVHHGDGVEDAFAHTAKVMTVSFHKFEDGFYPGTGDVTDVGFGKGKDFCVNVPLRDGIRDKLFFYVFSRVMSFVKKTFNPNAIVCQCGVDGLAGDPMEAFNLTPIGLGNCVEYLLKWKLPILFLGGGGYNVTNAARCWTYLTSVITGIPIPNDIPDNPYFLEFGPDFTLEITPGNRPNRNTDEFVDKLLSTIESRATKHL